MGMDIYLMKPILIDKSQWEETTGGEYANFYFYKVFKRFVYVKHKVHTVESMAAAVKLPVDEFIRWVDGEIADGNERGLRPISKYPYAEPFNYIKSEEIGYMDGNRIEPEFYDILNCKKIYHKETVELFMNNMFLKDNGVDFDSLAYFKEYILSKFVEGETFISFK